MSDIYTHGHHESVLRSHAWRTAGNSAAYLLGELHPGQRLLDVGCGPGTITLDLARRVAPGQVIGIDAEPDVLRGADELRRRQGIDNVTFEPGDAYGLAYDDDSFDIINLHQVLQHLTDPVRAMIELRRVLAPGGVLAYAGRHRGARAHGPLPGDAARWFRSLTTLRSRDDSTRVEFVGKRR